MPNLSGHYSSHSEVNTFVPILFHFPNRTTAGLSVNDILAELEDEEEAAGPINVGILPPLENSTADSDVDSVASNDDADEEDAFALQRNLVHLPRRILRSDTHVTVRSSGDSEEGTQAASPLDCAAGPSREGARATPAPGPPHGVKRKAGGAKTGGDKTGGTDNRPWKEPTRQPLFSSTVPKQTEDRGAAARETVKEGDCMSAFNILMNTELVDMIIRESNRYALLKGESLNLSREELYVFFGIMIFSGYHQVPQPRMYWEDSPDTNIPLVQNAMRRDRFHKILQYIHLADNNDINEDRFYKVREAYVLLNKNLKSVNLGTNLSIDETMVPYFGRHGSKQFIRGKPIRFGFKLWGICDSDDGWIHHVEPYCGSSTALPNTGLGQGGDVVLGLVEAAGVGEKNRLYFDNLFTSVKLLKELDRRGIKSTGTLRENRVSPQMNFTPKKTFEKKCVRGQCEERLSPDGSICALRWMDNGAVTMLSTCHAKLPLHDANRYDRKGKRKIVVRMPDSVYNYNQYMGGNDLADQNTAVYRCKVRSRKWWWTLFNWVVTTSAVHGWLLMKRLHPAEVKKDNSQLHFRRRLVGYLLGRFGTRPLRPGVRTSLTDVAFVLRQDRTLPHLITKNEEQSSRARCRLCNGRTPYTCGTCDVPLHPGCFVLFHN